MLMKEIQEENKKDDRKHGINAEIKQDEMPEITKNTTIQTFDDTTAKRNNYFQGNFFFQIC